MKHEMSYGSASLLLHVRNAQARIDAFRAETREDGRALIAQALDRLRHTGCREVLGPIGADTWGPYRLVIETDDTPAFPGEPDTPLFHAACFADNGFSVRATYRSTIDTAPRLPDRQAPADLVIAEWDSTNPPGDMAAIHALANRAFASAPFFAPIDLDRFTAIHAPLLASLPTRYCLVGRDGAGEIVSCLLGYPSAAGLVLKTLMSARPGAGSTLVDAFYRRAIADGQRAIIHALMHEDNVSTRMSGKRNGRVFRRYALFGRAL